MVKTSKKLKLQFFTTALALICLTATVGFLPGALADINYTGMLPVDPNLSAPTGTYRWLDVADQEYGTTFQNTNVYSQATVKVAYSTAGSSLSGTITASNLKPNFAYQIKLAGAPGDTGNEQIGFAGRWWQEEWNGATWINGKNINDQTYIDNHDEPYSISPPVNRYRITGYLVFDYFITENDGAATLQFETGSSYHVLWKTTQASSPLNGGPTKTATFDPTSAEPAYHDTDYPSNTVSILGEWERLPPGQVNLPPGEYNCQIVLTEESFHGSGGALAGNWAGAMTADLNFTIVPALPLPEYPLGALITLSACIAAFAVYKTAKIKLKKLSPSQIAQLHPFQIIVRRFHL